MLKSSSTPQINIASCAASEASVLSSKAIENASNLAIFSFKLFFYIISHHFYPLDNCASEASVLSSKAI
jgi:hypothetical protein